MTTLVRFGLAVLLRTPVWVLAVLLCGTVVGDLVDVSRGRADHVAPTGLLFAFWLAARLAPERVRRALLLHLFAVRRLRL